MPAKRLSIFDDNACEEAWYLRLLLVLIYSADLTMPAKRPGIFDTHASVDWLIMPAKRLDIFDAAIGSINIENYRGIQMPTLNYKYGMKAPVENADIVFDQMQKGFDYYNRLAWVEKNRLDLLREKELKESSPEAKEIRLRRNELYRGYRGNCGLYWGTYQIVEEAALVAAKAAAKEERKQRAIAEKKGKEFDPSGIGPHRKRWNWKGAISVQIIKGTPAENIYNDHKQIRVEGEGKRRVLWIRVSSNGMSPIWAKFPIFWHRELPEGSIIKRVKVLRKRVGTKLKWSALFTLDTKPEPYTHTKEVVGIDIGWRVRPTGIRAAHWFDGKESGELIVPFRLVDRYNKTHDLRSIRDHNLNAMKKELRKERKSNKSKWPEWLVKRTTHIHSWKSQGRVAGLVLHWRNNRFDGDEEIFEVLEAWRKQDKHLLEWESNQRENVLRARREIYRLFTRQIMKYKHVVIEDFDLREFAELPETEGGVESPITRNARPNRFKVALSTLRNHMVQAVNRTGGVVSEADPAYTTKECSWCGSIENFDAAVNLTQVCSNCGVEWDQDLNAARNLYRAAEWCKEPGKKSIKKTVGDTGKTAAELRRERGLETRREASRKRREKSKK